MKVPAYVLDPKFHTQTPQTIPGLPGLFSDEPVTAEEIGLKVGEIDEMIKDGGLPLKKVQVDAVDDDEPKATAPAGAPKEG